MWFMMIKFVPLLMKSGGFGDLAAAAAAAAAAG